MQTRKLTDNVRHELIGYAFNVVYLTIVFAAFTQYRRFLPAAALVEFFAQKATDDVLADGLVVLVTLISFFAVKELGRVLGRERDAAYFFRNRVEQ